MAFKIKTASMKVMSNSQIMSILKKVMALELSNSEMLKGLGLICIDYRVETEINSLIIIIL